MDNGLDQRDEATSGALNQPSQKQAKGPSRIITLVATLVASLVSLKSAEAKPKNGKTQGATVAAVAEDPNINIARGLFEQGAKFYEKGDYKNALGRLQASFVISQKNPLRYNIARCYLNLSDIPNAIKWLEEYLVNLQPGEKDQKAEEMLARLKSNLQPSPPSIQTPSKPDAQAVAPAPHIPILPVRSPTSEGSPLPKAKTTQETHHARRVSLGGSVRSFVSASHHFNGGTSGVEGGWGGRFILTHEKTGVTFNIGYDQDYGTFLAQAGEAREIAEWVSERCHMAAFGIGKEWRRGKFVGGLFAEGSVGWCGFEGEKVESHDGLVGSLGALGTAAYRIERKGVKVDIGAGAGPEARFGDNDATLGAKLLPFTLTVTH